MRRYFSLSIKGLFLLALIFGLLACGGKQYVGKSYNTSNWNQFSSSYLPAHGSQADSWFVWKYTIDKGSKVNEYILTGTADSSQRASKVYNMVIPHRSTFSLILANDGTVVDNIEFFLNGTSMDEPLSFEKTFECQNSFNASAIFWRARVGGKDGVY